jgi:hypothetical protein
VCIIVSTFTSIPTFVLVNSKDYVFLFIIFMFLPSKFSLSVETKADVSDI